MTQNPEKLIPLNWNQFPLDRSWKDVVVKFDVTVTTKSLSLNLISEEQKFRHDLIMTLHDEGLSDKEISKYLNERGILTPTGLEYYPKMIWVTRKKLHDRHNRKKNFKLEMGKIDFYLKKKSDVFKKLRTLR